MTPRVSVVVSTKNRPEDVVACVRGILANPGSGFELVVVDQSEAQVRQRAAAAVGVDSRLRWIGTETQGLSASRNIGVASSRAPIIAFTDDDCRVPADWVSRIEAAFAADPEIALVFGAVVLSKEDRARGYAAEFEPTEARAFRDALPDGRSRWGVGANMAIRRAVIDRVGPFDPVLGAGSPFRAGEEIDFTIRAVSSGFTTIHTPAIAVAHLGVREGRDASHLIRGYGIGLGAALTKHVRLGTAGALRVLTQWLAMQSRHSVQRALLGDRHPGFGLLTAVLLGVYRSFECEIDRPCGLYRSGD